MAKTTLGWVASLGSVHKPPHGHHGPWSCRWKKRRAVRTVCLSFTKYTSFSHNFPLPNDFSRNFLHWRSLRAASFYSFSKELSGKYFKLNGFCQLHNSSVHRACTRAQLFSRV